MLDKFLWKFIHLPLLSTKGDFTRFWKSNKPPFISHGLQILSDVLHWKKHITMLMDTHWASTRFGSSFWVFVEKQDKSMLSFKNVIIPDPNLSLTWECIKLELATCLILILYAAITGHVKKIHNFSVSRCPWQLFFFSKCIVSY